MRPTRPLLRWHGGKWRLADWVIRHMPPHRTYCEPFGGAASVLLRKPRAYSEVYNDLDDDLVGLFHVLRDEKMAAKLLDGLRLTLFARAEWEIARQPSEDPIENARRLVVRSFMGFGSDASKPNAATGFRAKSDRSGTTPPRDWVNYPDALRKIVVRLQGVVIEHRDALACMAQHDGPETLHYLDPPYVHASRTRVGKTRGYRHEMTDADHERLLAECGRLEGMVMLSGYRSDIYAGALRGWSCFTVKAYADKAQPRTECLWLNPSAAERRRDLFSIARAA